MLTCPDCTNGKIIMYGHTHYGRQRYQCNNCQWQFMATNDYWIAPKRES
ncbi:transposase-like protein [Lewinella antarctica]|uniref:Transposase-like protein n=1 Tax=Neolewinella antarctica TaxID=442734 RepID=A0ABX0XD53_9BACT|nr:transposase-like protein [Neolewinella antarctica]